LRKIKNGREEVRLGKDRKERKTGGGKLFIELAPFTGAYAYPSGFSMRPFLTAIDGEGMVIFHDSELPPRFRN